MKVSAVSMRRLSDGEVEISVSTILAANEELDGSELGTIERFIKEFAGAQVPVKQPVEAPAEGRRRRAPAEPEKEPGASGEPVGRRRRGATASDAQEPSAAATESAPTEGRRRRATSAEPAATSDASDATTGKAEEPRRRRGAATEPEAPKTPSDADLVKAATAANEALTKALGKEGQEKILDLMDEYDGTDGKPVSRIDKLKAENRDEFLQRLKALVADNT